MNQTIVAHMDRILFSHLRKFIHRQQAGQILPWDTTKRRTLP
jgi:hypothetical protein